jgi:hypothetical protein
VPRLSPSPASASRETHRARAAAAPTHGEAAGLPGPRTCPHQPARALGSRSRRACGRSGSRTWRGEQPNATCMYYSYATSV